MDVRFLARAAPSGECLRGEGLVWLIVAVLCVVAAAFALQHHWLLPINCHFLRLYSAAGRGIAAVSSAIEESDLYLFTVMVAPMVVRTKNKQSNGNYEIILAVKFSVFFLENCGKEILLGGPIHCRSPT